jgi:hypothetical protein
MGMRPSNSIARYKLLPETSSNGSAPQPIRRYRLARVGVARRSALGADRHERLEDVAALDEKRKRLGQHGPA